MSGSGSGGSGASVASGVAAPAPISAPSANRQLSQSLVWSPPKKAANGCCHLKDWMAKTPAWKQVYGTILRYVNTQHMQRRMRKVIMERPTCCGCGDGVQRRLLVSLHSVYVGCVEKGCFKEHSKSTGNNLSVELDRGELFCMACNDYIYDSDVEEVRSQAIEQMQGLQRAKCGRGPGSGPIGRHLGDEESALKRARGNDGKKETPGCLGVADGDVPMFSIPRRSEWAPTAQQLECMQSNTQVPENKDVIGGLRGFHNVGNTCFLNCVLQGLVHNPGLRDYFLGDYHNRHRCMQKREAESKGEQVCMGCEMDRLLNDFFQPSKQAYTPHQFLYAMWKSSQHLAGYEQQDAHECFISVLTALQTSCESDVAGKGGMIQHLFSGCMRSDVTCLKCKTASITRDPFVDISLDLKSHTTLGHEKVSEQTSEASGLQANAQGTGVRGDDQLMKDSASVSGVEEDAGKVGSLAKGMWDGACNKGGGQNGADGPSSKFPVNQTHHENHVLAYQTNAGGSQAPSSGLHEDAPVSTVSLKQCLEWFTRVEKLDAKAYKCDGCNSYQEGLKQLSIQTLAPSLCLQLKRFESLRNGGHNGGQQSFKVDTHVVFPAWLNMAPYLSDGGCKSNCISVESANMPVASSRSEGHRSDLEDDDALGLEPIWYHLYAVVVHHGKLDSGHYTSFFRRGGDWFRCDDAAIVLVPETEVLSSQAYLLLYNVAS